MHRNTLKSALAEARRRVEAHATDGASRLALRRAFYARYGDPLIAGEGLGTAELDFLEWEVRRGVLKPGGSQWWRSVNLGLCQDAEAAAAVWEWATHAPSEAVLASLTPAVRFWIHFLRAPSATTWYRAHNRSIVDGYFGALASARDEAPTEQAFLRQVLDRVLFAEALNENSQGTALEFAANPRFVAVALLVSSDTLYPLTYPAPPERGLLSSLVNFDDVLDSALEVALDGAIDLVREPLYRAAAVWLDDSRLLGLVSSGKLRYP
ncbi:MAG: hypothetical protein IV100_07270 [Myxococcales bacterium]|nr:hypothetical protein [Myxococcales bacterium]